MICVHLGRARSQLGAPVGTGEHGKGMQEHGCSVSRVQPELRMHGEGMSMASYLRVGYGDSYSSFMKVSGFACLKTLRNRNCSCTDRGPIRKALGEKKAPIVLHSQRKLPIH